MSEEEAASLTFEIVDEATTRGNPRLVDNKGYSYTRGRGSPGVINWRCTVRNAKTYCKATVRQHGEHFVSGWVRHCHDPNEEALSMARAVSRINREMKARPNDSPSQVVMEVINCEFGAGCVDETNLAKLIRRAQYQKRVLQPKNTTSPSDIRENEPAPWTFEVVEDATRRGKPRLLDNRGYSYTQTKNSARGSTVWRCTIRNSKVYCRATVRQTGFVFVCGMVEHCHEPDSAALLKAKFTCKLNKEVRARPHESAASIVKKVISAEFAAENPSPLKISNLVRSVNYQRKAARPKDPVTLDFELNEAALPHGFLRADIFVAGRRHLIFMSVPMANVLCQACTWYCDAGLPVVPRPFTQLLTIQAFMRSGASCRLQPLALVWMSDNRKEDYSAVFLRVLEVLPTMPKVNTAVLGFDAAMWQGMQEVLPHIALQGCHLSWNQVVWEKMQELELIPSYHGLDTTRKFCRQVMALPFLPVGEILPMYGEFAESTEDSSQCYKDLIHFIRELFIENPLFPPSSWSVYQRPIRTLQDLDSWHKRLSHKASKRHLGFYQLVNIMCKESNLNESQVCLVTEQELVKYQKAKYSRMQAKVFDHWDYLARQEITALDLLNEVAEFNGPDEKMDEMYPVLITDSLCKTEVIIE